MSVSIQSNSIQKQEDPYPELMAFFSAIDEVFFSTDFIDSRVIRISDSCEKLFGYKADDFLDDLQLWLRLVHPEDRHIVANQNDLLQKGEIVNSQYRIIHKDNTIRWVEKKLSPILDEAGNLISFNGVIRDITARKEEDENHRKSEAMYRRIVETAQEGIWTIDENEKTNFVNKKIAEILGYTQQEMLGKGLYDFMDEEGKAYAIACMERRRAGAKEKLDIRYVTKAGNNVWTNISANPIFDEAGNYKGALAMVTDITDRKADEEALKKSEANLRTIFDNTDTAYILIDTKLRIVSFNMLAQKYSEQNNDIPLEINKPIKKYFRPGRWPAIQQYIDKVAKGEAISYELNLPEKNGNAKWYQVRWVSVKNTEGKNWGFILANKDITEAKNATLERERIIADLIQHNNDLKQFTYIVSHNLRAPVANIIGLTDILVEDDLEADVRQEITNRVSISVKNIDVVIKDLNHILQARAINEKKETVYFAKLVKSIKTSIYTADQNEEIQFNCAFNEVESIFTIRSYAYSIFYNLVSNSIKYCRQGVPPLINISSHKLANKIELRFKDNGKGIDLKKNGNQVFGLYKRFDTSTEGKGMGLFMVKTQVEALGGTIEIKSKVGEGTEFIIQFSL
ncbi:PAS domain S-box-containing protein [Mucilaginibacter mallensis]|uniref:histidine kinase n=1 Tax=Mucilaginibacter mallensis TaxID=652787 RepID=A0A1H1MDI9_MUCMA|nr:PAS domain-containing sensor histidine kinase [Mucilaginibacter mallensis]SDR84766.1 PAS domain S-box-containing protein [Mucilaginibacter mallensis]